MAAASFLLGKGKRSIAVKTCMYISQFRFMPVDSCQCYTLEVTISDPRWEQRHRKDFLHIEGLNSPGEKRCNISSH